MPQRSKKSGFNGYNLNGEAEYENDGLADIQVMTTRSKPKQAVEATTLQIIASKFKRGYMNNITLKNTSKEDYELYTRLVANKDRAILEIDSTTEIGLRKETTKTIETLSFIVGRYKNKIYDALKEKQIFVDVYDREDPMEIAKVITLTKGSHKTVEVRFNVDTKTILDEWHRDFNLDSKPETQVKPRLATPWEKRGLSEEEFNKRRGMARLDDLLEQSPDKFQKLLDLIETL